MMLRHARMQVEYKGGAIGIREMRKHVAWYTADPALGETARSDQPGGEPAGAGTDAE
mgnify:CR=1 FL=1